MVLVSIYLLCAFQISRKLFQFLLLFVFVFFFMILTRINFIIKNISAQIPLRLPGRDPGPIYLTIFPQAGALTTKLRLTQHPHCKENPIYVFLFWELRDLSPNFHIHVTVSDLYIPRMGPLHIFPCSRIGRPNLEICKSLTDI